jgi:hypothetical protein
MSGNKAISNAAHAARNITQSKQPETSNKKGNKRKTPTIVVKLTSCKATQIEQEENKSPVKEAIRCGAQHRCQNNHKSSGGKHNQK